MNRAISLSVYRLILRSHPAPFLARFGDEMLWIFEEECQRGATVRLLCDGILSLLRQRFNAQDEPVRTSASFGVLISEPISEFRLLQGALIASLFFAGFLLLLPPGRGPLPGSPLPTLLQTRQAPSDIVTLPETPR
jgi:hypothetical protein